MHIDIIYKEDGLIKNMVRFQINHTRGYWNKLFENPPFGGMSDCLLESCINNDINTEILYAGYLNHQQIMERPEQF